jgi:uncharacterized protein (TIGR02271 family)
MALVKIDQYYPDYREQSNENDIKSFDVYTQGGDKIGSVQDILVDEQEGRFRYLIVDTGFWVLGKKVLLPIGLAHINTGERRVYVDGLTKSQVESLPEFRDNMVVDRKYEDQVRHVYRPSTATGATGATAASTASTSAQTTNQDIYDYRQEPGLYDLGDRNQTIRLYEERLIANKHRQKTGEVSVGKHVETETARVEVPVEKERVIIERTNTDTVGRPVAPGEAAFQEGAVAHVDVYEEQADVHKEAFVREQVNVRKEVERETVNAQEQIRREELDVEGTGQEIIDRTGKNRDRR